MSSPSALTNQKMPLVFALGATTAIAALSLGYKFFMIYYRKKNNEKSIPSNPSSALTDDSEAIRLLQPQFDQAAELARTLQVNNGTMTVNDQLMMYGLYKQAKFGDCSGDVPSQLRIKERAKHDAWTKFKGLSQPFAITKYIEVVQHFSKLATEGETTNSDRSFSPRSSAPLTNYSYIQDDDDSDIIYENDDGEVDTIDGDEYEEDDHGTQNIGMGQQSTLLNDISHLGGFGKEPNIPVDEEDMTILQAATQNKPSRLRKCIQMYHDDCARKNNTNNNDDDAGSDGQQRYDVNETDETGQTPLHMAADKGNVECVSLLIDAGANVNATDDTGISVLGAAVCGEDVKVVKMLLEAGANPDLEDMDGDTPRSCAMDGDCEQIKQLFIAI